MPIKINSSNPFSTVVTLNNSLKKISKNFGSDARQLDVMRAQLDAVLGDGATKINAAGRLVVRNTNDVRKALSDPEVAKAIELPTYQEYLEQAKARVRTDTGQDKVSKREAIAHEERVDKVKRASEDGTLKQILSGQKASGLIKSGYTWNELAELVGLTESDDIDINDGSWSFGDAEWIEKGDDFFNGGTGSITRI